MFSYTRGGGKTGDSSNSGKACGDEPTAGEEVAHDETFLEGLWPVIMARMRPVKPARTTMVM